MKDYLHRVYHCLYELYHCVTNTPGWKYIEKDGSFSFELKDDKTNFLLEVYVYRENNSNLNCHWRITNTKNDLNGTGTTASLEASKKCAMAVYKVLKERC
jgi:hypothetical protein